MGGYPCCCAREERSNCFYNVDGFIINPARKTFLEWEVTPLANTNDGFGLVPATGLTGAPSGSAVLDLVETGSPGSYACSYHATIPASISWGTRLLNSPPCGLWSAPAGNISGTLEIDMAGSGPTSVSIAGNFALAPNEGPHVCDGNSRFGKFYAAGGWILGTGAGGLQRWTWGAAPFTTANGYIRTVTASKIRIEKVGHPEIFGSVGQSVASSFACRPFPAQGCNSNWQNMATGNVSYGFKSITWHYGGGVPAP